MRQCNGAVDLAGININANVVAAAESICLIDRACQRQLFATGKACADHDVAGRFFYDTDVQVHLIRRALHLRRVNGGVRKKAKTAKSVTRQSDFIAVIP